RLREVLTFSRNLVSIRILRSVGVGNAIRHLQRFGFDRARMPRDLSLALGSAVFSPLEMATGYAVFANGGYRVEPWVVERIEDQTGAVIHAHVPLVAVEPPPEEPPAPEDVPLEPVPDVAPAWLPA